MVSSAYRLLREDFDTPSTLNWKLVWKLDVPERVRSFVWQIMHGKLATKVYCSKWSDSPPNCHRCSGTSETISRVLHDCPCASSVWLQLVPFAMRSNFFGHSFPDWVVYNVESEEGSVWRSLWAATCFFLLKWRNLEVHDDNYVRPFAAASVIRNYVQQYFLSKQNFNPSSKGPKRMVNICWKLSSSGWTTLNTDGAATDGRTGCCGVLGDAGGSWLSGFTRYLEDVSAFVAEFWGVIEGLKVARQMGLHNVELQVDSKVVVSILSRGAEGSMDGRTLVTRIRSLLQMDWHVSITHVYREVNSVADSLATMACDSPHGLHLLDQPPAHILHLLHSDCIGISTPRFITL